MGEWSKIGPPGYVNGAPVGVGVPVPHGWAQPNQVQVPPPRYAQAGDFGNWPGLNDCLCALKEMLEGTLTTGDMAPHIHQPFDAVTLELVTRAVVNIPAALDANANAGGIALAAAEGQFQAVTLLTPTNNAAPLNPVTVVAYTCPQGWVSVFKKIGMTVEVGNPSAANVSVQNTGENQSSAGPNPLTTGAAAFEEQQTMLIIPENKSLNVQVQNLDVGSPLLVRTALSGWQIPIRRYEQTLKSMLKKPGYGVYCQKCGG